MAEARSAVGRPLVTEFEEGRDSVHDATRAWWRSIFRRCYRTKNSIRNGLWPTSIYNLAITVGILTVLLIGDWPWAEPITRQLWKFEDFIQIIKGLPYYFRVVVLSSTFGFVFFILLMYVRRYLLRILLSYRRWMYEPPKSQSIRTILWAVLVRFVSGYAPSLYSYQSSLPRMPVPPLRDTLVGLIESLKPLYGPDSVKIEELKKQSKVFQKTLGSKLQRLLLLKSWWSSNYVTGWWEKYIYLMGRSPLLINSNYYILDHGYWKPTEHQCARAAATMYMAMEFKQQVEREQLTPLVIRNTIPLCMAQYRRIFSTTRIPHVEMDELRHFDDTVSKHIVVLRSGHFYRVEMVNNRGQLIPPNILEAQFEWIVEDAAKHEISEAASCLPALTAWNRTNWANTRDKFFSSDVNKAFLDVIESAIFFITLETAAPHAFTARAQASIHGDGRNIWADKSATLLFFADGKMAANGEHSWADAPVLAHLLEYIYTAEVLTNTTYYENGHCRDPTGAAASTYGSIKNPERLIWQMPDQLAETITTAYKFVCENNADLDLVVRDHRSYGKGFVKTCRLSPDAYIQVALQLAYYKLHAKFALTYESAMTRLFLCGRTETVRSLTQEMADFVLAMSADSVDRGLKKRLLRRACDKHQKMYRDSMAGGGIDRHLFALYVICRGLGNESEFLQSTLSLPWTLSTSQQPQQQIAASISCDMPEFRDAISPGGGFGPVSDAGYGVSYMIAGDFRFFFHISSKRSCIETDSTKFADALFDSLSDIKALFDGPRELEL